METLNISVIPGGQFQKIHVSQNDVGRTIILNLKDKRGWFDLTGCTVKLEGIKPSGLGYSVEGTADGHTVTIVTSKQMTDEYGSIASELKITKTGLAIGTANVMLEVEKDPHPEGTTDGSIDEIIPEITILVERAEAASEAIQNMGATASTGPAGSSATVTKTVDPDTGAVTLDFTIPRGDKGETGDAFHIVKTYASVAAMNADYSGTDTEIGDYVMIATSSIEDPDNAKVYIKGNQAFEFVVDMSGATGIQGPPGVAAGFGTVTASVDSNVGTPSVEVLTSGPNTAKCFSFTFHNLKGADGEDGYSPTATVTKSGGTATISITDKNGTTTETVEDGQDGNDGNDGYSPTATVTKSGGTVTISITDKNGTTTETVNDGQDGNDGNDGVSPVITITAISGGTRVTITDAAHPSGQSFDILNGSGAGDMLSSVYDSDSAVATEGGIASYVSAAISGKADTADLAAVATSGDYDDLDNKPTIPSVTGKADKVSGATNGNFAALNSNGNLKDSGISPDDIPSKVSDLSNDTGFVTATPVQVTLPTNGWSSNSQTVNVTGVTTESNVIVAPAPASAETYGDCGVICSAKGSGTLTFTCTETPGEALTVNVLIIA